MKKIAALAGMLALLVGLIMAPASAQAVPVSGRTIVYPLENPPSTDTVTQPARFTRLAIGAWLMQELNLTASGDGVYAGCTTAPASGLYVEVSPTVSGSVCGLYQVQPDDANPIPVGYTPQLAADPTLIVVQALQTGSTSQIGPLTPPGSNSVYWLLEGQLQTSDGAVDSRGFFNPITGAIASQSVNTQRQDAIVFQTKEGTPGVSPAKPAVDSGWVAFAYVLVPSGTSTITTGMISAGAVFGGLTTVTYGEVSCTVAAATSCSATATAPNGSVCGGAYNATDTTVDLSGLEPAAISAVSSSTATFTLQTSSATGTLAYNYQCFL